MTNYTLATKKCGMLVVTMLSSLLFFSCEVKELEGPKVSLVSLITGSSQKTWIITGTTTNEEDASNQQLSCVVDNLIVFHKSGLAEVYEGETKCNGGDEELVHSSSWTVSEETSAFVWIKEYRILSIAETKMILEFSAQESNTVITLDKVE